MPHRCHVVGCNRSCQPRYLMCRECWAFVPKELSARVTETNTRRQRRVNASWAPWWRAAHEAIAHVMVHRGAPRHAKLLLDRARAFADRLETTRPTDLASNA